MAKVTKAEYEIAESAVAAVAKQICLKRGIDPDIPACMQKLKSSNVSPYVNDRYGCSLSSPAWQDHMYEGRANIEYVLDGGSQDDPTLPEGCVFLPVEELCVSDEAWTIIKKILGKSDG